MLKRRSVRMTRTAISPRFAIRTLLNTRASHPEDAVASGVERGVCRHGQGQAEHPAGVGGVDDPVVPEPRCRVVRVALRLVLVADGLLERLFLLRRPVAAT